MIRTVLCDLGRPAITGDDIPTTGHLTWAPTRIRVVDKHVTLPSSFDAALNGGVVEVKLAAPDGNWAWTVREIVPDGRRNPRLVHIPEGPEDEVLLYGDLVEIDPKTLDPAASPEAAWWVQQMAQAKRLDELTTEVKALVTSAGETSAGELDSRIAEAVAAFMADQPAPDPALPVDPEQLTASVKAAVTQALTDFSVLRGGKGPPPEEPIGYRLGADYTDLTTGIIYELEG